VFKIPGVSYIPNCEYCKLIQEKELLVEEYSNYFVIVNPKPFNNGHLLIIHKQHKSFDEISITELKQAYEICSKYVKILQKLYNCHGIIIGYILKPHFVLHVVPRWNGDVSFVSVFFNTRVVPETPFDTVKRLREFLKSSQ